MKHLLDIGIKQVVCLEPYPRSYASKMFTESISNITCISIDNDRLNCVPFHGVDSSRLLYMFKRKPDECKHINGDTKSNEVHYPETPSLEYNSLESNKPI